MVIKSKESYLSAFFMVIIVLSSVIQFGIYRDFPLFPMTVLACGVLFVFFNGIVVLKVFPPVVCFFIFVVMFFSIISSLKLGGIDALFDYGFFFFSAYIVSYIARGMDVRFFIHFLYIVVLLLCVGSFINGFSWYRFEGLYDNPNGMGRFSTGFLGVLILWVYYGSSGYKSKVVLWGLLAVLLVFSLASNSRGSIASMVFPFFIMLSFFSVKRFLFLSVDRYINKTLLLRVVGLLLLIFSFLGVLGFFGGFDEVLDKFSTTSERGDLSQGRLDRWDAVFPYITALGMGKDAPLLYGVEALHNNYLSLSFYFGYLTAIPFYLVFICLSTISFIRWEQGRGACYSFSFFCFSYYCFYSVVEAGSAIFIVWLGFAFYSLARFNDSYFISGSLTSSCVGCKADSRACSL